MLDHNKNHLSCNSRTVDQNKKWPFGDQQPIVLLPPFWLLLDLSTGNGAQTGRRGYEEFFLRCVCVCVGGRGCVCVEEGLQCRGQRSKTKRETETDPRSGSGLWNEDGNETVQCFQFNWKWESSILPPMKSGEERRKRVMGKREGKRMEQRVKGTLPSSSVWRKQYGSSFFCSAILNCWIHYSCMLGPSACAHMCFSLCVYVMLGDIWMCGGVRVCVCVWVTFWLPVLQMHQFVSVWRHIKWLKETFLWVSCKQNRISSLLSSRQLQDRICSPGSAGLWKAYMNISKLAGSSWGKKKLDLLPWAKLHDACTKTPACFATYLLT